ncbi:hypothetical protein KY325_00440 [Candidatus Woesearchaeota archaeon]|nr:hypothetical protein [Candidatus Woesearchaeota archaeon]MBW3017613.1 hypothetical protein [Candidatus Woesearchaeota archaeon]
MAQERLGRIYEVKRTKGSSKVTGILRNRATGGTSWTGTKVEYEAPASLDLRVDDIVEYVPGRIVNKEKSVRIMKVTKVVKSTKY